MEDKLTKVGPHSLVLKEDKMCITGVTKVNNVNENSFVCKLQGRNLQVSGSGIHILLWDVERGEVELEGKVNSVKYVGASAKRSIIKRILG